jgi:hypothetical protein
MAGIYSLLRTPTAGDAISHTLVYRSFTWDDTTVATFLPTTEGLVGWYGGIKLQRPW